MGQLRAVLVAQVSTISLESVLPSPFNSHHTCGANRTRTSNLTLWRMKQAQRGAVSGGARVSYQACDPAHHCPLPSPTLSCKLDRTWWAECTGRAQAEWTGRWRSWEVSADWVLGTWWAKRQQSQVARTWEGWCRGGCGAGGCGVRVQDRCSPAPAQGWGLFLSAACHMGRQQGPLSLMARSRVSGCPLAVGVPVLQKRTR